MIKNKFKIISNGTTTGTKIIDLDTGEAISCVQEITWSCNANDPLVSCTIKLINVEIEVKPE